MIRRVFAYWLLAGVCICAGADRTILAVGAHAGDAEISAGAVLARQKRLGDRVVILHMSLGEGGNPKMPPKAYGEQKRREAEEAAKALGAEVLFGPYKDGEVPDNQEAARYVARIIRQVKPTHVITHWKNSLHRDHAATYKVVTEAVLLASLDGVVMDEPRWRGTRGVYYAENWEDMEGFAPYLFVDVSEDVEKWKSAVTKYEFIRGGISSFRYLDYYTALATVRGAVSGKGQAVAFDIDSWGKKRIVESLP
jgi:N-acetylglucosamine malate deacetylase 1